MKHRKRKQMLQDVVIQGTQTVFRPFYFAEDKIEDLYAQEYGALVEFIQGKSTEWGPDAKVGGNLAELVLKFLAELNFGAKWKRDRNEKYEMSSILQFKLLLKLWEEDKRLVPLDSPGQDWAQTSEIVIHRGQFHFAQEASKLSDLFTPAQLSKIDAQKSFEEGAEGKHYVYAPHCGHSVVAILSDSYVTHAGRRYLSRMFPQKLPTTMVAAPIELFHDLLLLDPIAIGEERSK